MTAPAPADASGRNSLSHSDPGMASVPTMPVNTRAAATGVPNSAPIVPETASITSSAGGTLVEKRPKTATASAELTAIVGFSGPRLTPPASPRIVTSRIVGTAMSFGGVPPSSVVAESGPP